jgi:phospholipase/carboxylesterase
MPVETFGDLQATLAGGTDGKGGGDGPLVVLLHGFGAPGDDLVPLARVIPAPPGARFVFPRAPLSMPGFFGDARAWWMLDLEQLERDLAAGLPRDRMGEEPEGLPAARAHMAKFLADVDARLGSSMPMILGGFSQGAMLALDTALHVERELAGVVLLSSTFLAADVWGPRMSVRAGLPVFQSHGRVDPLLPFAIAEKLRGALTEAGLPVTWVPFDGGHEIPPQAIAALGEFFTERLAT